MAGGGGTRFWPWSTEKAPKQLLPILSGRSMVRETADRLRVFIPPERILIVTSRPHAAAIMRDIPRIPKGNFLIEPAGRNTAPCLCLAGLFIERIDPEAPMVVLPADHAIGNGRVFLDTVRAACDAAAGSELLVTLGVPPAAPETGYGYIQKGETIGRALGKTVFQVKAFREKPTLAKAKAYLRRGDYFWNSGIFIWRTDVFWNAVREFLPGLFKEMDVLRAAWGTSRRGKTLAEVYSRCRPVSIDYGVMEKAGNAALIEARFGWDDVGTWSALWKLRAKDADGNACILSKEASRGKVLALDSSGCLIRGEEKLIAVLGMKDTVVVEAGKALLVCPRDRAQDVRRVIEDLQAKGWGEYL